MGNQKLQRYAKSGRISGPEHATSFLITHKYERGNVYFIASTPPQLWCCFIFEVIHTIHYNLQ